MYTILFNVCSIQFGRTYVPPTSDAVDVSAAGAVATTGAVVVFLHERRASGAYMFVRVCITGDA